MTVPTPIAERLAENGIAVLCQRDVAGYSRNVIGIVRRKLSDGRELISPGLSKTRFLIKDDEKCGKRIESSGGLWRCLNDHETETSAPSLREALLWLGCSEEDAAHMEEDISNLAPSSDRDDERERVVNILTSNRIAILSHGGDIEHVFLSLSEDAAITTPYFTRHGQVYLSLRNEELWEKAGSIRRTREGWRLQEGRAEAHAYLALIERLTSSTLCLEQKAKARNTLEKLGARLDYLLPI